MDKQNKEKNNQIELLKKENQNQKQTLESKYSDIENKYKNIEKELNNQITLKDGNCRANYKEFTFEISIHF